MSRNKFKCVIGILCTLLILPMSHVFAEDLKIFNETKLDKCKLRLKILITTLRHNPALICQACRQKAAA